VSNPFSRRARKQTPSMISGPKLSPEREASGSLALNAASTSATLRYRPVPASSKASLNHRLCRGSSSIRGPTMLADRRSSLTWILQGGCYAQRPTPAGLERAGTAESHSLTSSPADKRTARKPRGGRVFSPGRCFAAQRAMKRGSRSNALSWAHSTSGFVRSRPQRLPLN
jgi:hypothetical protein